MKRAIKTTAILGAAIFASVTLNAQKGINLNLDYNISTPVSSEFKDFIKSTSFGGFQASVLYGFSDRLKAGLQTTYSSYLHKPSHNFRNIVKSSLLLAKMEYSFLPGGIQPFVGFGTGFDFIRVETDRAGNREHRTYNKWAFAGDAGVVIALSKSGRYGFRVSTSYLLRPLNIKDMDHLDSWDVQAGIAVRL